MSDSATPRKIDGRCHCGNIRFVLSWPVAEGSIPVRACSCSFCTKHGGVYTSHPDAEVDVRIEDVQQVQRYRFGTATADFHICRTCGVVPIVTSRIDGTLYAVVNVNSFEGVDPSELNSSVTDFDGETTDDRLARRQRNWIPKVMFDGSAS